MWLEMSRDEEHGGAGWRFTKCLWSTSRTESLKTWAFWDTLLRVKKGDLVFHLRGRTHRAAFVGYLTSPPSMHQPSSELSNLKTSCLEILPENSNYGWIIFQG